MAIDAQKRKKYATIHSVDSSGKERDKFPIFDKNSAESAEKLIGHAKPPLTAAQKAKVKNKAKKFEDKSA